MSLEQFKTFYWPGLRKVMIALIDQGLTPYLLLEGKWGLGRLEVISDIPKGKAIYHFESVDIYEAKEILGNVVCLKGNVPTSLLVTGTPREVKAYSKKLIDVLGRDGGFIMDAGAIIDEAKPENIKAMTDFTREYGVY
jgi:uroporphyrinogen-III decarboxylase